MDLRLTPEQELIRKTVRSFADEHVKPKAAEWDENKTFPRETIPMLAEVGLMVWSLGDWFHCS